MRAVVLDGSRDESGQALLGTLTQVLGTTGYETAIIALRAMTIAPCVGCFGCWIKTPGECVIDDGGRAVARSIAQCDLLVYFTPVTFGGVSSELKKALDRLIPSILPFFSRVHGETHHAWRYERPPSLLALGTLPKADPDAERLFKTLAGRNALNFRSLRTAAGVVALDRLEDATSRVCDLVGAVTG